MEDFIPQISSSIDNTIYSLGFFYPELALVLAFLVVIITDLFFSKKNPQLVFVLTLTSILAVTVLILLQAKTTPAELFGGIIVADRLGIQFKLLFCLASFLFLIFIRYNKNLKQHAKGTGDLYAILLAVHLGLNLMAMSSSLLMIYISIEMVSVGSYLMVGYVSADKKQTEAAMKYALFGAACSALMLYGISLLYGFTGELNLFDPMFISGLNNLTGLSAGVALMMVFIGIGFKLSFVPMHFWSPDVYEGAPTPVTAFLSTAPKVAGFAVLTRFLTAFDYSAAEAGFIVFDFTTLLSVVAIASMIVGNFGAIWQNNAKRMLAYSSIGHTGFLLMAVIAFSESGLKALNFYLLIYIIMNMAAFMLVNEVENQTGTENLKEYKGLGSHMPVLMVCFVIVLISLTGLPPTAGFTAKFLVLSSALEKYQATGSVYILLTIITGAVTTLVSLFYYFKIPLNAFLRKSEKPYLIIRYSPLIYCCVALTAFLVILIIFPGIVIDLL